MHRLLAYFDVYCHSLENLESEMCMSNSQRYKEAFINTFGVTEAQLIFLAYQSIPAWDSVGHMELMTVLEDSFCIQLDIDDIIDFSSYEKGKLILQKNGVQIDIS